ncbi:hypothetical protein GCM10023318_25930 [Nocardia callitridis]|uniref:DUF4333 domain-containing protein n=2 Tax=Nocardia callitridis TaxID=648753 RepID=A0ABP9K762_9NOCA
MFSDRAHTGGYRVYNKCEWRREMSGPFGPNDPGEGRNDPTQVWGGQQQQGPGGPDPTQQWGGQPPQQQPHTPSSAQPTQQWGGEQQQPPQQGWGQPQPPQQGWGQPQPQQGQPQPQWGQPGQPQPGQPQWGQPQPPQQPQDWQQGQQGQQGQDWQQQGQPQWGQQQQPQPQWGQQPDQQQWGGQQQLQQSQGGGKSKKGLFIGLGVLAVVVIGAIVAVILTLTAKDKLDQAAVQDGVQKVLSESYGIQDVNNVSCPADKEVAVDASFECTLDVSGEAKKVTIKITKDDGTYEVGRPN